METTLYGLYLTLVAFSVLINIACWRWRWLAKFLYIIEMLQFSVKLGIPQPLENSLGIWMNMLLILYFFVFAANWKHGIVGNVTAVVGRIFMPTIWVTDLSVVFD